MADKVALIVPSIPNRDTSVSSDTTRTDTANRATNVDIRRPLDGVTLSDDTYATISLLSGGDLLNTSVATGTSASTANLLVQSLSFSVTEKHQRAQTFDKDRLFFFGQTLPSLRIEAITLDSLTFQWLQELYENYTTRLGGSIAAENGAKVQITSDDRVYTGYILEMSFTKNAQVRATANVSMSMALTNLTHLKSLQSTFFNQPTSSDMSQSLSSVSESLSGGSTAPADTSTSLASQISNNSINTQQLLSGELSFSDVFVNEYPNRGLKPATIRNPQKEQTTLAPLDPIVQNQGVLFNVQEFVKTGQAGVLVLPEESQGALAASDIDVPSVIPTSQAIPASIAETRNVTDDIPTVDEPSLFDEIVEQNLAMFSLMFIPR